MLKGSRRWSPIACLLCVLLILASVDRVADPPAVNPHGSDMKALCFHHTVEAAADQVALGHGFITLFLAGPLCPIQTQPFRTHLSAIRVTAMRQAADPSPPFSGFSPFTA